MGSLKNRFVKFSSLACLLGLLPLAQGNCLPKDPDVVAGSARFERKPGSLTIMPSDQAILDYEAFSIGPQETLSFVQGSSSSCVLNRIRNQNPAEIFGRLESTGQVFLLAPGGIYFGRDSQVHVGGLVATTLEITKEDFLEGRYVFKGGSGSVINEGTLFSEGGSIGLVGSSVQNTGTIVAKAGSVSLIAGEHVTLDFTGDGLMRFCVEGSIKDTVIEQAGDLLGSTVEIKTSAAKQALSDLIQVEGIEEGEIFIEDNGQIKLVSSSYIETRDLLIESTSTHIEGQIKASSERDLGAKVQILGKEIELKSATLDVSGKEAGTVLIGGDFQGKASVPWATDVLMDADSKIQVSSSATVEGGLVVLWSKESTSFHGSIIAEGGLVETSSKGNLNIDGAKVSTRSITGSMGQWLLDPDSTTIAEGDFGSSCLCDNTQPTCVLNVNSINQADSNVTVASTFSTIVLSEINMENGVDLSFISCGSSPTTVFLTQNITTGGGSLDFSGTVQQVGDGFGGTFDITLNTSAGSGGDITLPKVITSSGNSSVTLTLNAGSNGHVDVYSPSVGSEGSSDAVFSFNGLEVVNAGSISTAGIVINGAILFPSCPVTLTAPPDGNTVTLATTWQSAAGRELSVPGTIDSSSGVSTFFVDGGDDFSTTLGSIGSSAPPTSCIIDAKNLVLTAGFIETGSGGLNLRQPLELTDATTFQTDSGPVNLDGAIFGSQDLTISSGAGAISAASLGDREQNQFLKNISLTGGNVALSGGIATTDSGSFSVVNSGVFSLSSSSIVAGSITQSGGGSSQIGATLESRGSISFADPISMTAALSFFAEEDITLSAELTPTGVFDLTLSSESGSIESGALGSSAAPLGSVSVISSQSYDLDGIVTQGKIVTLDAPILLSSSSEIDTTQNGAVSGAEILFTQSVNAASGSTATLTLDSGQAPITFQSDVGALEPLSSLSVQAGSLVLPSSLSTTGAISLSTPMTLDTDAVINSNGGGVTLAGDVTGPSSLSIFAGSGDITTQNLGSVSANAFLDTIILSGNAITLGGSVATSTEEGSFTLTNSGTLSIESAEVSLSGALSQSGGGEVLLGQKISSSKSIEFEGAITLTGDATLDAAGKIQLSSDLIGALDYALTLVSYADSITVQNLGTNASPLGSTTVSALGLFSSGAIVTEGRAIDIQAPLSLPSSVTYDTTQGGAQFGGSNITLGQGVEPASGVLAGLTLSAGEAGVQIKGAVGAESPLTNLSLTGGSIVLPSSINCSEDVTLTGAALVLESLTLSAGGNLTASSFDTDVSAANPQSLTLSVGGSLSFSEMGQMSYEGSKTLDAITLTANVIEQTGAVSGQGAITYDSTGSFSLGGDITSSSSSVILGGPATITTESLVLTAATSLDVGGSSLSGAADVSLIAETGSLTFTDIGRDVAVLSFTGRGETIFLEGSVFASELSLTGDLSLETDVTLSAASSSMTINGAVDSGASVGPRSLTLQASGAVSLTGIYGEVYPLGALEVSAESSTVETAIYTSNGQVSFTGPLQLASSLIIDTDGGSINIGDVSAQSESYLLDLVAGGGSVSVGAIGSEEAVLSSVFLQGNQVNLTGDIYLEAGGPLEIDNAGLLTLSQTDGSLTLSCRFEQIGQGSSLIEQTTSFDSALFEGPLTLSESLTLSALSDLIFNSSIDAQTGADVALTLSPGEELIISGAAGSSEAFSSFTLATGKSAQLSSVTATGAITLVPPLTLSQETFFVSSGGGVSLDSDVTGTFPLTISAGTGDILVQSLGNSSAGVYLDTITLAGEAITLGGSVATSTEEGSLILTNSSSLTLESGDVSLSGSLTQSGGGEVFLANNITSLGLISFADPVTLSGSSALDAVSSITLSSNLSASSDYDLSLISHASSITTKGLGSSSLPLGSLTVSALSFFTPGDIVTQGKPITVQAPTRLISSVSFDTTQAGGSSAGSPINFTQEVEPTSNGVYSLILTAGASEITLEGAVGAENSLNSFSATGGALTLPSLIQTTGTLTLSGPSLLVEPTTLQSGAALQAGTFDTRSSALAPQTLSLISSGGDVSFGALGLLSEPDSLTLQTIKVEGSVLTQTAGARAEGSIDYSGSSIVLTGDLLSEFSSIALKGPITLSSDVTLSSAQFLNLQGSTLDGAYALSVLSAAGEISLSRIGSLEPPVSFVAKAPFALLSDSITAGGFEIEADMTLSSDVELSALSGNGGLIGGVNSDASASPRSVIASSPTLLTVSGVSGSVHPLSDVTFEAPSLFLSASITTQGADIQLTGEVELSGDSAFTTSGDTSKLGADLSFSAGVNAAATSSASLTIDLGSGGSLILNEDVGAQAPLESFTLTQAESAMIYSITALDRIDIAAPTDLSSEQTTLSTLGGEGIFLDTIDGFSPGAQSLTLSAPSGSIVMGAIGSNTPLAELVIQEATSASVQDITLTTSFNSEVPLTLVSSATFSTKGAGSPGGTITLGSVDGLGVGQESLRVDAGSKTLNLTGKIGALIPPGSLDLSGSSIQLTTSIVAAFGSQTYSGPVSINSSLTKLYSVGDMTFESSVEPGLASSSVFFYPGGGSLEVMGSLGDAPLNAIRIYDAGRISLQDVSANSLGIAGGLAEVFLEGEIQLQSPSVLFIDAGPLHLGNEIHTAISWIKTVGSITNLGFPMPFNITGNPASRFNLTSINAVDGDIGSFISPIELNSSPRPIVGAASRADFIGEPQYNFVLLNPFNTPCVVTFNESVLVNCNLEPVPLTPIQIFEEQVPKTLFYITWTYSSWDNLSGPMFFEPQAIGLGQRGPWSLFYQKGVYSITDPEKEDSMGKLKASSVGFEEPSYSFTVQLKGSAPTLPFEVQPISYYPESLFYPHETMIDLEESNWVESLR